MLEKVIELHVESQASDENVASFVALKAEIV